MGDGSRTRDLRALIQRSDLVLLVGTRTNQNGTDSWTLLPADARYVHLDIAAEEVRRNYESIRLVGDVRTTLGALDTALDLQDRNRRAGTREALAAEIRAAVDGWLRYTSPVRTGDRSPIRPERVMHELDALLTPQTIVVADAGYSSVWITNCLTVRRAGQRLLTPRGLAGLGWGLPYAICAKLAAPSCSVVCVASDGGFAHTWAEIETMKRLGLPIVVIVLNNHILGYQKHANSVLLGGWTDTCHFVAVDHAALACGQPVVRDVITDPEAYPPITAFQGRLPSTYRAAALLLAGLVVLDRLLDVGVLPVW